MSSSQPPSSSSSSNEDETTLIEIEQGERVAYIDPAHVTQVIELSDDDDEGADNEAHRAGRRLVADGDTVYDEDDDLADVEDDGAGRAEDADGDGDMMFDNGGDDDDDDVTDPAAHLTDEQLQAMRDDPNAFGDSVQHFLEHELSVHCVALAPNASLALTGDESDVAYLWDTQSGSVVSKLTGHTDTVIACGFSHDGQYMATASMDATVRVYSVASHALLHTLDGPGAEIESLAWHSAGPLLLASSADGTIWLWNAPQGKLMGTFTGHSGSVIVAAFSHDGKLVVSVGEDGDLRVWNPKTSATVHRLKALHDGPILSLAVHPTQPLVLTGGADSIAKLVNIDTAKVLYTFKAHTDGVESVGFSSTLKLASTASVDGSLRIWDLTTGQSRTVCNHESPVIVARWHPTQPFVVTGAADGSVRVWDARQGLLVDTLHGHQEQVLALAIDKAGQSIVSVADDSASLVFRLSTESRAASKTMSSSSSSTVSAAPSSSSSSSSSSSTSTTSSTR